MIILFSSRRTWFFLLAALATTGLVFAPAVYGETSGVNAYVSIVAPESSADADALSSLEAMGKTINELDAAGLLLLVSDPAQPIERAVTALRKGAPQLGARLWIAARFDSSQVDALAQSVADLPVAGVALLFAASEAEPIDQADMAALLQRKQAGDLLGQAVRKLKLGLNEKQQLALCLPYTEMLPETSRRQYVPLGDLVRDGTVDTVCLSGQDTFNFHRLRLLRKKPLRAGILVEAETAEERTWGPLIARRTLAANQNATCDCLWLVGFPAEMALRRAREAVAGHKLALKRRQALETAIASGQLVVDQEVSEEASSDQSTVHGVAQSFTPTRDGVCSLVELYVAMRGCQGPLPPPLAVEIRPDADGKPADTVLAATEVSPLELGHEPDYRWATASFKTPVPLKQGVPYWLYLPPATHEQGSYVWRMAKDAGTPACHAWSRRYDYVAHTWVFRVYFKKEPSQ